MNTKCRLAIEKYTMLEYGDSIVVGLSGGADSCAMLHFLCGIRDELGLKITAVHVNHMIRGEEAERDAKFSEEFCRSLGVEFLLFRRDIPKLAGERGMGLEECGRAVRYEIFENEAKKRDGKIATAHTLSDSAETVIFHIIRGCAVKGLRGIPPVRGNIIRPLIFCGREDIETYCVEHNIKYITDSTNLSSDYARNKIRLQILPLMREINPSVESAICRLSECAACDDDYLSELSHEIAEEYLEKNSAERLFGADVSTASRALEEICHRKLEIIPEHRHISAMLECLKKKNGSVNLTRGNIFLVKGEKIKFVTREDAQKDNLTENLWNCELKVGKIITPTGQKISVTIFDKKNYDNILKINKNVFQNALNYDTIENTAKFRFRNEGDLFRQAGRGVTKSLKKLFNERKIPVEKRATIPVLECGGTIVWIYGIGVAEGFQVTDDTKKIICIDVAAEV